jgi:hypothetical protein
MEPPASEGSSAAWLAVPGRVVRGHRVASGLAPDSPYPRGTIEMQLPFFRALGLDLTPYFPATLNVSIAPLTFQMLAPEHTFRYVAWTDRHPPEHFSFSCCRVHFNEQCYAGWVYYPHPETKQRHFQNPSLLEILAPHISDLSYGDRLSVTVNLREIAIVNTPE